MAEEKPGLRFRECPERGPPAVIAIIDRPERILALPQVCELVVGRLVTRD